MMSVEDRFWSKVVRDPDTECWEWIAGNHQGYGRFVAGGRNVAAHRWSYERLVGPIPEGLQLDHLCRNPPCVNPDHLEPVTGFVNTLRGTSFAPKNKAKTHCPHGHEYTLENTYYSRKGRECRECRRVYQRERRAPRPGRDWRRGEQRIQR